MDRIVVGVDGSPGSRAALDWAVADARRRGAEVEAVMAWEDPAGGAMWTSPMSVVVEDPAAVVEEHRSALEDLLRATDASGLPGPIAGSLRHGNAARVLLDAAEGADLLVVGTRGHGGFIGAVLGSITHKVTTHAPCPVVVVPTPDEG